MTGDILRRCEQRLERAKETRDPRAGRLGWSLRRIEKETGIRRETIAGYLKTADIAVRPPRGWGKKQPDSTPANGVTTDFGGEKPAMANVGQDAKPANEVIPGSPPPKRTPSASEPFRELIEQALSRGRNAKAIWQDLVDDHGFTGGYQSVKRFINKLHGTPEKQPCAVIVTAPGEEAQVDYGEGPMVRDPQSGRYRRTRLFVLTLGFSRKCVRLIVFTSSTRTWAELHEAAFARLGGTPRVLVLDNLREGVLKPDIYDPTINPLYRDMLTHYQAIALPCRIKSRIRTAKERLNPASAMRRRRRSKASVSKHSKKRKPTWTAGKSIGPTRAFMARRSVKWRRCSPKRSPLYGRFPLSPPAITNTANAPFTWMAAWKLRPRTTARRRAGSARWVNAQWDHNHVRLLDPRTGQLLREHRRQPRGVHRILPEDRHQKVPFTTQQLLQRAAHASTAIGSFCKTMYAQQGQRAIRRMQGILAMAKKYGVAPVDDACSAAAAVEVYEYPFIRAISNTKDQRHCLCAKSIP